MKIGILTFHCAYNYGAVMQCYALQQSLESMGHDVEVIDYRPGYLVEPYKIFDCKRLSGRTPMEYIRNTVLEFLKIGKRLKRAYTFGGFIDKELNLSSEKGYLSISDKYDAYIIGSDQVWNVGLTGGAPDKAYFADFPFPKGKKIYISYAASMGGYKIDADDYGRYIKDSLERFDFISVREEGMINQLKPLIPQKKIDTVLDPTLMADNGIWDDIIKKPELKKKYVLVYKFISDRKVMDIARNIASQIGGTVVEISHKFNMGFGNEHYSCASPQEFLGWFKYADYVITTSFHGTAFSLIFQKPFYCIRYNNPNDYRTESLLEKLGLGDRMIDVKDSPQISGIDYSMVSPILNGMKKQSKDFLLNL